MKRALELAKFGEGFTSPNPMVGCVVVARNNIIGEGFHACYGEAHAEVQAIRSVKARELLSESTLYVSLEPCNHTGKTPPCTGLIVQNNIPHVVIATKDPNPLVAGSGIRFLEEAGIHVSCGILDQEAAFLNRRFFTFHQKQRPYIILRWAESADGFTDPPRTDTERFSIPVSGSISRQMSHRWRTEEQAILVGSQTVITDNPSLSARLWPGKNPLRILFDSTLRVPAESHLLTDGHPTLVYNRIRQEQQGNLEFIKVDVTADIIQAMLEGLVQRNIISVMVEGGPETIRRFLAAGQWDEIRRFRAPVLLRGGVPAPQITFLPDEAISSGNDRLEIFYRKNLEFVG